MPDEFVLHLDLSELIAYSENLAKEIKDRLEHAAKSLAIQTHAHVKEQAAFKLKTRLPEFLEHFDIEQVDKSTWAVTVRKDGRWIEDGMEPHSMLDSLLSSPKAKMAKDGSKYVVVPFKHNKGPTQQTPHAQAIKHALKEELRARKIAYSKIERNPDGSPKEGLVHKIDLNPNKRKLPSGHQGPATFPQATHHTQNGVEGPEGRPFLFGVRIYQKGKKNPDGSPKLNKAGQQMASREIFTFRIASSKHAGSDKWFHPGLAPMNFLDEAYDWAADQWDNVMAPEILRGLE